MISANQTGSNQSILLRLERVFDYIKDLTKDIKKKLVFMLWFYLFFCLKGDFYKKFWMTNNNFHLLFVVWVSVMIKVWSNVWYFFLTLFWGDETKEDNIVLRNLKKKSCKRAKGCEPTNPCLEMISFSFWFYEIRMKIGGGIGLRKSPKYNGKNVD